MHLKHKRLALAKTSMKLQNTGYVAVYDIRAENTTVADSYNAAAHAGQTGK